MSRVARRWLLRGRVQGVGFRPFVARLARRLRVRGWVLNRGGEVEVHGEAPTAWLDAMQVALVREAPPASRPRLVSVRDVAAEAVTGFGILPSAPAAQPHVHLPPDLFMCGDCARELLDPDDRRHRYPFINCTQCGPRYTVIRGLPYDRSNTTMAAFRLCPDCAREYANPEDRRFHAQPLACPACGPRLLYRGGDGPPREAQAALAAVLTDLARGLVVAVRGIGGYHLVCDAHSDAAVGRLRTGKHRPDKPLAVMFPWRGDDGLEAVRAHVILEEAEAGLLRSPERPIVLAAWRPDSGLSGALAPGLGELGVLLPYSPLHHLLLHDFDAPLVVTSGNPGGEPVVCDPAEAETRLEPMVDAFLHHNRPIHQPADDPLFRRLAGRMRALRLGRGTAPLELPLATPLPRAMVALGGQIKATLALGWRDRAVVSPHIGDVHSPRGLELLMGLARRYQELYGVSAEAVVCDAHPGFSSPRRAAVLGRPLIRVFHHHAHAAALAGEYPQHRNWLIFTWDGVGLGTDGTLWGGETLLGRPGAWQRVASLRRFRLPGGEAASRQPWRSACGMSWELAEPCAPQWDRGPLREAWRRGLNAPWTSAVGRLFDAAAFMVLGIRESSFEGQAPMLLEAAAGPPGEALPLPLSADAGGLPRLDWGPLVAVLRDPALPAPRRAALVHDTLGLAVASQARRFCENGAVDAVGLTGGVFQNRRLVDAVLTAAEGLPVPVRIPTRLPGNDGGLSFGQLVEAGAGFQYQAAGG